MARVRVYMGCSPDGFIAGPDNDLDWLSEDRAHPNNLAADAEGLGFAAFMDPIGATLMDRTPHDVVAAMGWPCGETPLLVATRAFFSVPPQGVERSVRYPYLR